jgi:hypothetical protein
MGQAKIRRDRQRAEDEKRKADAPIQSAILMPPNEPTKEENTPAVQKAIIIDISQVPKERQTDQLFLFCLADVRAKLNDPKEIRAICIHEAAHLFYMTKAGMKDPEFSGPRITYDKQTGKYDRYGASVRCPNRDEALLSTMTVGEWAFRIAKAHAAGGVAAQVMAGRPKTDSGDSEDQTNLITAYKMIRDRCPTQTTSSEEMWNEAQRILAIELQEPPRRELILSIADAIKPDLFKS